MINDISVYCRDPNGGGETLQCQWEEQSWQGGQARSIIPILPGARLGSTQTTWYFLIRPSWWTALTGWAPRCWASRRSWTSRSAAMRSVQSRQTRQKTGSTNTFTITGSHVKQHQLHHSGEGHRVHLRQVHLDWLQPNANHPALLWQFPRGQFGRMESACGGVR